MLSLFSDFSRMERASILLKLGACLRRGVCLFLPEKFTSQSGSASLSFGVEGLERSRQLLSTPNSSAN